MHIKQIILSNFRSFRDQGGDIECFHPGMNSVVGRNGSGKSNLFDAVQFVLLTPRFANLRQEERQALLHEGSGSSAVSAYVEIVFDNTDHRFQLENSDEVVMRRTIGLHKDEFFLQRRRTTKAEIQSLLEGAGFSKSNPYYIVQQGKVQDLCTMADTDRLRWLQQVAGTVVYDEKKAESMRKMMENEASRGQIQELLNDMDQRLAELQTERDELTQYSQLDRQRRAVEYSLYHLEWKKARDLLAVLEEERVQHQDLVRECRENCRESHHQIQATDARAKGISNEAKHNRRHIMELQDDKKEAVQLYTQLQVQCRELEDFLRTGQEVHEQNQQELQHVEREIQETKSRLNDRVQPMYQEAVRQLQEWTDQRAAAVREMEALYAKQGRVQQFHSKEERDAHLKRNLEELESIQQEKESELVGLRDQLASLRRAVERRTKDIEKQNEEVRQQSGTLQSFLKAMDQKKMQRMELIDARKEEWRKVEELKEKARDTRGNYEQALSDLRKTMPRATMMGLDALKDIVEQEGFIHGQQYFGMLMNNFSLKDEKYQTAVEVAAQNSLFHVIVDTDQTASRLMMKLEQGRLGRVTFLPLNQLRVDRFENPESDDVRPMLDLCIDYDPKVELALRHVFHKKLIARTRDHALEWSSKIGVDAITLDGDLCSRKGAMTGGYVDTSKSRLRAFRRLQQVELELQNANRDYHQADRRAKETDNESSELVRELQNLEAKRAQLTNAVSTQEGQLERMQSELGHTRKQLESVESNSIPTLERDIDTLRGDILRIKDEMGTELAVSLSNQERSRLNELKQIQSEITNHIEAQNEKVASIGLERQKLMSLLDDNLMKRQRELLEGVQDDDPNSQVRKGRMSSAAVLELKKNELDELRKRLEIQKRVKDSVEARLDEARAKEEKYREELSSWRNESERLKSQDDAYGKALTEANEKTDRLMNKRSMCISKRDTYARKIQELGSLPPPAEIDKVSGKSISELMKLLESVNKKLKNYSHVNKKAFDQFVNFSEQRESLLKRKEELDSGAVKVKELIESLDRQKDEAINRTFRGVRTHFREVFKEIVPLGEGDLIMRTSLDAGEGGTDDEESIDESELAKKSGKKAVPKSDVSLYRGIGVKVRFSPVGENYIMSQLSGGQKALVALALIFAIQRCDPAPFYLFDELDQALDSSYRANVADLIRRQANDPENPTQFIVSTFRPELVQKSNRWFGISHQNKMSNFHSLTKADSLHFIANLMDEEEALGEVTTISTARTSRLTGSSLRKRKSLVDSVDEDISGEKVDVGSG